jgi:hypothetical protein
LLKHPIRASQSNKNSTKYERAVSTEKALMMSDQTYNGNDILKFAIPMRAKTLEEMADQINEIVGRVFENSDGDQFLYAGIFNVSLVMALEFHVVEKDGEDFIPQRIYEAIIVPEIHQIQSGEETNV